MKVALIHDWLHSTHGGAERVFLRFYDLFPDADVYTLLFDEERYGNVIDPHKVHTSFLQSLPESMKKNKKYLLPFLRPAIEEWNFEDYDLVLSSSGAWTKNVSTPHTLHICYCHTPARFLWDYEERYLDEVKASKISHYIGSKFAQSLKSWDARTRNVDTFIANSRTVQERIKTYYNRKSTVIYPPVEVSNIKPEKSTGNFYVTLSTLSRYKKIDLAVQAFNQTTKKLLIIGDGPERERLEKMAKSNIAFTGFIPDQKKIELLQKAKGLIFPNEEDFGIAPVEALAAGTPVIGYNKGGVTETIQHNKTGVLFDEQNETSLLTAVKRAETQHFSPERLHQAAIKYGSKRFDKEISHFINRTLDNSSNPAQLKSNQIDVLGVPVNTVSIAETLTYFKNHLTGSNPNLLHVSTVNTEFVMQAQDDKEFNDILHETDLNVPDGIGVVWAVKSFGGSLSGRVTGVDLMQQTCRLAAEENASIFLLGGDPGVAEKTADKLRADIDGLDVAGTYEGSPNPEEADKIIERINNCGADILFIAFSAPDPDKWIRRHQKRLQYVKIAFGVGGSFDFIVGKAQRAPKLMQRIGLEWFWRLLQEPKRLRRQLAIPKFIVLTLQQWWKQR